MLFGFHERAAGWRSVAQDDNHTPIGRLAFPAEIRSCECRLRGGLGGDGFGAFGGEVEADEPFAGDAMAAGFG